MFRFRGKVSSYYYNIRIHFCRSLCTNYVKDIGRVLAVEKLDQRGLLRISGKEVFDFLQGMVTNDVRHLDNSDAMYALFLNTKGRVMCDSILYKTAEQNVLLIECDVSSLSLLEKHLKMYRVRRKIDVDIVDDKLKVWVYYNPAFGETNTYFSDTDIITPSKVQQWKKSMIIDSSMFDLQDFLIKHEGVLASRDPRLVSLGYRIVAPAEKDVVKMFTETYNSSLLYKGNLNYRSFRYLLGVGEGTVDLPPGSAFPLEANCDYLHGVSFHKGCYIGQELTARTYHTGVIRKRLMPFIFHSKPGINIPPDAPVHTAESSKKSAGKIKNVEGYIGLGLLRIAEALATTHLCVLGHTGETYRPLWWPHEAPKERTAVVRES